MRVVWLGVKRWQRFEAGSLQKISASFLLALRSYWVFTQLNRNQ
jgi:hypothetical protein